MPGKAGLPVLGGGVSTLQLPEGEGPCPCCAAAVASQTRGLAGLGWSSSCRPARDSLRACGNSCGCVTLCWCPEMWPQTRGSFLGVWGLCENDKASSPHLSSCFGLSKCSYEGGIKSPGGDQVGALHARSGCGCSACRGQMSSVCRIRERGLKDKVKGGKHAVVGGCWAKALAVCPTS